MAAVITLQFIAATLLPVAASVMFYLLQQRTAFGKKSYWFQQVTIGIVFGIIAVCGTEFGINTEDATMNVRDAAPLTAGLMFGGPSGIIAGIIGGVERWFSVLWGRGQFTQLGCTIATIAVGFYAAALRKYMFEGKKPSWPFALITGVVAEVLHLTLIFVTNMAEIERAIMVVRACTLPMVTCNGVSVMLSAMVTRWLSHEKANYDPDERKLSQAVQAGMLASVLLAFSATTVFTYVLQSGLMREQTSSILSLNIQDVLDDIQDASDQNMLKVAHTAANKIGSVDNGRDMSMLELTRELGVSEVDVIDSNGVIVNSTFADYVGFSMASGAQSSEFLVLLDGSTEEYVQSYQPMSYDRSTWRKYAGIAVDGGFIQVGYGTTDFQSRIAEQVSGATRNRHVGETGSMIICDAEGIIVSAPGDLEGKTLESTGLGTVVEMVEPGELFKAEFLDTSVYGIMDESEGYRVIALLPETEAHFARNAAVLVGSYMEIIVFALLFGVIYFLIKRLVVDNIRQVNGTLAKITDGDLDALVDVHGSEEFVSLSSDINTTVAALKDAIAAAAARIDAELEYARTIQRDALPRVFPPYPSHTDFQIYATMDAAKEVGGDFYDFYLLDDDHFVFLIADVSGKGIPGALFMMRAKTLLKSLADSGLPVEQVLTQANEQLCQNNEAEMFVTCWMGVLDLSSGRVTFGNAGHNPPVIMHTGSPSAFHMARPNLVLAGMEGIRYRAHEVDMLPGDTIFLYTDGVTEATDAYNQLFGDDRLLASLDARANEDVKSLCKGVHTDVDQFVGDAPQFDDITVLALRYVGRGSHEA